MEQQAQTLSEIYTAAKEGDDSAFYPQKYRPVLLPKEDYIPTATELGGEEGLPIRLLADVKTLTNPLNGDLPYLPANGIQFDWGHIFLCVFHNSVVRKIEFITSNERSEDSYVDLGDFFVFVF